MPLRSLALRSAPFYAFISDRWLPYLQFSSTLIGLFQFTFTDPYFQNLPPEPLPPEKPGIQRASVPATTAGIDLRENIYTLPNLLTLSRIAACPALGYFILHGNFVAATALLAYAGVTDLVRSTCCMKQSMRLNFLLLTCQVDGWMARRWNQTSVLGTILDPAADKLLMTVLTVTLAMRGLLPGQSVPLIPRNLFATRFLIRTSVPLAVIIIGRDVLLALSAFVWRYVTLPPPVRDVTLAVV